MIRKILFLMLGLLVISPLLVTELFAQSPDPSDTIKAKTETDSASSSSEMASDSLREPVVLLMEITGAITRVTDIRVTDAIARAEDELATGKDVQLIVFTMDTPGGYTSATGEICRSILNSPVPVCVYVAPSGSRAGSAGVYITYASHIAAMAPSTNIGAAHPVSGEGKDIDSIMNEKVTNDAVAQIKAAAERRGRNVEWAEQAVRESKSITNREALEMHVVDINARDLDDLFDQINGRTVDLPSGKREVHTHNAIVERVESTFVQRVLQVLSDPNIVFILFSIGGLGIVLELYHPGAILPGVVGAISLILAFFASYVLPINYAGVALILLAVVLFIAEIKITSAGLLTIGGLVSLFLGGLMLVDTVDPNLQVSKSVLFAVVTCVGVCVAFVMWFVVKAMKNRPFTGQEGMVGKTAEIRSNGMVYVDGALWHVESNEALTPGMKVEVIGVDKLKLVVRKTDIQ